MHEKYVKKKSNKINGSIKPIWTNVNPGYKKINNLNIAKLHNLHVHTV